MSWACLRWVRDLDGFPRGVKPVAQAVALRVDDQDHAWHGIAADIAADVGCSVKTVNRALKWLDDVGVLVRKDIYNPATGYKVRQEIRFVMLTELPTPLRTKNEENSIKDTVSFRPESDPDLKDTVSGLKDKTEGPKGHGVQPKGHGVPSSTTLPTLNHTHTTSARVNENPKSSSGQPQPSADVEAGYERFVRAFPPERLDLGREALRDLFIAECKSIHPRPPEDLARAAEAYRKRQKPGCLGLNASKFLGDRRYESHLTKLATPSPAAETPDDLAHWDAYFDEAMRTGEWSPGGLTMAQCFWAAPATAWERAFRRSPDSKAAARLRGKLRELNRVHYPRQFKFWEMLEALPFEFEKLRDTGEWQSLEWPDPREEPGMFPAWLINGWKNRPARTTAAA